MSIHIGKTLREIPKDVEIISHQFLVRGGYIHQYASGLYALMPLAQRIIGKIQKICHQFMQQRMGAQEVLMTNLSPEEIWKPSGRSVSLGSDMFRLQDRQKGSFVLCFTHEEPVVDMMKSQISSYRQLPVCVYQIQTKFRDEPRPRAGLIRLREFLMKDAYSFHKKEDDFEAYFNEMAKTYELFFKALGFTNVISVKSDNGNFGGNFSQEFILPTEIGEDTILNCQKCGMIANQEVLEKPSPDGACPQATCPFEKSKGMELGHIFHLGDRYTKPLGCYYTDEKGQKQIPEMGCYGIGITRLLPAIMETHHDEKGPIFPLTVAPYEIHMIHFKGCFDKAEEIYQSLIGEQLEVLWDDREEKPGAAFADADLIGIPFRIIVTPRSLEKNMVEVRRRDPSIPPTDIPVDQIINFMTQALDAEYKLYLA